MSNVHFSQMPNIAIPRSRLKLIQKVKNSFNFGKLVPIDALPILPGDDAANIEIRGIVRMSQPIVPIMDDIELNVYAFFVPSRILWQNFEPWFTTGDSTGRDGGPIKISNGASTEALPYWSICVNGVTSGCIAEHFGKPLFTANAELDGAGVVNVMKEKAYYRIWHDWFIPAQVVSSTPNKAGTPRLGTYVINSVTTNVDPNSELLPVCKSFDYFTACTLSPQYSSGNVTIPLGTIAPVIGYSPNNVPQYHSLVGNLMFKNATAWNGAKNAVFYNTGAGNVGSLAIDHGTYSAGTVKTVTETNMVADLSNAAAATINSLRQAFAVQKYCERSNYGNRFFEAITAHFSVVSPDARLQRAEYIGHGKCLINVDQVVSTAGYDVGSSQEVGSPGAISLTGFKFRLGSKGFVEPGYLVILASTRQVSHTYSQGVMREDSKLTKFEFYSPEFANLGDQAILNKEIMLQGTSADTGVFGYQEHWAEDRYRPSRVCGLLNPNATGALDYWTMADKYASLPNYSASFLFENRDNIARCLTTSSTGPDFIGDFHVEYLMDRPLPVYTIPGLIDHFGTR